MDKNFACDLQTPTPSFHYISTQLCSNQIVVWANTVEYCNNIVFS